MGTTIKNDFVTLAILDVLVFIITLKTAGIIELVTRGLIICMMIYGATLASKSDKKAGYIGVILGILMIATLLDQDYLDAFLGLFVLIHSIRFLNNYKNQAK